MNWSLSSFRGGGLHIIYMYIHWSMNAVSHTPIHCAHLTLLFCRCMLAPALSKSINLSLKYARYFLLLFYSLVVISYQLLFLKSHETGTIVALRKSM